MAETNKEKTKMEKINDYRKKALENIEKSYNTMKIQLTRLLTRYTIGSNVSKDPEKMNKTRKQLEKLNNQHDLVTKKPTDENINIYLDNYPGGKYNDNEYKSGIDGINKEYEKIDPLRDLNPDDLNKYNQAGRIVETYTNLKNELKLDEENKKFINKTFPKNYNLMNGTTIDKNKLNHFIDEINDKIPENHETEKEAAEGPPEEFSSSGPSVPGSGPGPGPSVPGSGSGPSVPVSGDGSGVSIQKEAPPPDIPPPPLDELDILNDKLKNDIIGAWKEVSYDKDPSKKYWWNTITNETTSIGSPKPTGITATTPKPGFMSYDSQLKENSKTSFIIFVNLVLYPGTSIPEKERKKLACYLNYEEIRRSYAELLNNEYIPLPMNDPSYYKLDNDGKSRQTQNPSSSSSNLNKNTTTRRVSFNTGPPQRIQGGKNKTKRNHK